MFDESKSYKYVMFDCDGVILNSNGLKSRAFFNVACPYSIDAAKELVAYNKKFGGVSRSAKFDYFLKQILPKYTKNLPDISDLLKNFGDLVKEGLLNCELNEDIFAVCSKLKNSEFSVISGGDQTELRDVFNLRGLTNYFGAGIWGSPETKYEIIERNFSHVSPSDCLFIGDSKLDFEVARDFGFDFLFMSAWTEVDNWEEFVQRNAITHCVSLGNVFK